MNVNEIGFLQSAINNENLATVVLYSYRYYFRKLPLIDQNGDILRQRRYLIETEQYSLAFRMVQERNRAFSHNTSLFSKEIWNLILDYFVASVYDFFRFGRICRYWRDIADHSHLWFTRSLQFTIPEKLFKILMTDYKYVTKAKEEKFLLTLLEEQATKEGIINLCHQALRQSGFYQNRITSKDLQALGGHAALLHTMKCDVVRLIDGPEIFNYDFILRNTTLIERESLAYDMKLKMSALLRSYHYWWSWHATYRPKFHSVVSILDMISPRFFNELIYWIGMLSLVYLIFTFDEDFPKFLSLSSPFQSNQNHSLDVQAPDLLHVTFNYEKISYWIGFSVLYGLLGSYFFLIFKYVFEYVCKEYIFIGSVNRLTFLPIQLNIPWKDVILQDSYVIFLMNLALLSLGLFINTFLLQMKVMTISSNDFPLMMNNSTTTTATTTTMTTTTTTTTMTTTTTVLSSFSVKLCSSLNSFLSWKLIFSFFSIVMMTFIYIQMKLLQKVT